MLYDFKSGVSAAESSRRINAAFGEGTTSERSAHDWFARFRKGDESLEEAPRSGRSSEVDDDRLLQLVEDDPRQTIRELAGLLGVSQPTIVTHMAQLGKVYKMPQWVLHVLSARDRERRAEAASSLLSFRRRRDWLESIVTGDEKWCMYVNVKRRRSWVSAKSTPEPQPKAGLHPRKVMLCV